MIAFGTACGATTQATHWLWLFCQCCWQYAVWQYPHHTHTVFWQLSTEQTLFLRGGCGSAGGAFILLSMACPTIDGSAAIITPTTLVNSAKSVSTEFRGVSGRRPMLPGGSFIMQGGCLALCTGSGATSSAIAPRIGGTAFRKGGTLFAGGGCHGPRSPKVCGSPAKA